MLKREKIFNYDTKDMIGIMKFDFYDGCLANSWHWRSERNDFSKEEITELQDQVNNIVFDILGDFKKVKALVDKANKDREVLYYATFNKLFNFVIKLTGYKEEYNYVFAYRRH